MTRLHLQRKGRDSVHQEVPTDPSGRRSDGAVETEVISQQGMAGYAKAGIIVRNDMTGSGTTPKGVLLFESPSGGIQLEWDSNGGEYINSVTPANGNNPALLPVWLELVRNGSACYGGHKVGFVGEGGTLAFNNVTVPAAGTYDVPA